VPNPQNLTEKNNPTWRSEEIRLKHTLFLIALTAVLLLTSCQSELDVSQAANASETHKVDLPIVMNPLTPANATWAFEETFDGDPAAPSQALLPRSFGYAVTHRTHPCGPHRPVRTLPGRPRP
jgi:hypothetical protein